MGTEATASILPAFGQNEAMRGIPRFWLAMQIAIVICVIISAVIVVIKL
jgi:hypothetical protein